MTITESNLTGTGPLTEAPADGDALLEILFDLSSHSESLMATRHRARVNGCDLDIPKFMLLGQRGGGKPIRIALFGGIDDHHSDGIAAITRMLVQMELQPALARDYALFAYPLVNPMLPAQSDSRFALERPEEDLRFLRAELRKWRFDGILKLGTDPKAESFRATVRSALLAKEVVRPALERVRKVTPVGSRPIKLLPGDMKARQDDYAEGRLTAPPELRPYPFEAELIAPGTAPRELRIRSLFVAVHEILRLYRRLLAHATDI
jgi:hypothetical protein